MNKENKKQKKINIFTIIGLLLICAALLVTLRNIYENRAAGKAADEALTRLRELIPDPAQAQDNGIINETPIYEEYKEVDMPQINIDGSKYIGIVSLPSLGLELPVKGEFSYPALVGAPCRWSGSAYTGDLIIAGHNYPRHFGSLKNISIGDNAFFTDTDGNIFRYKVLEVVQLSGNDGELMRSGDWDMTLFTCTVSGKKRVTVRFEKYD